MPEYKRSQKIIKPRLQWRFMLLFAGLAACSVLVQTTALASTMGYLSGELPNDGSLLLTRIRPLLGLNLAITLAIVLPVHLLVGRAATFKVAGPLYNIEKHLRKVVEGEHPGLCRLRKDDELQELCALLNEALPPTQRVRSEAPLQEADQVLEEQPSLISSHENSLEQQAQD